MAPLPNKRSHPLHRQRWVLGCRRYAAQLLEDLLVTLLEVPLVIAFLPTKQLLCAVFVLGVVSKC